MITMCCNKNEFKIEELKTFSTKAKVRVIIRGIGEIVNGEFTKWRAADILPKYKKNTKETV